MKNPAIVYVPPVKDNITYYVAGKPTAGIAEAFNPIAEELKVNPNASRMIIFGRKYEDVTGIFYYLKSVLYTAKRIPGLC